jgi:biofilm PGA synthesis N-glycosyltransferase PgaC
MRAGYGQHFTGTSPLYLLPSAAYQLLQYPVFLGSAAMIWGYVSSAVRGLSRYDDRAFRSFLRRYQHQCLLYGKRETTRRRNERQAWVWQTAHQEKERAAAEHG